MDTSNAFAPRIYYLHPLLIGQLAAWDAHFEHAARLGFDHVLIAPPFLPGRDGDVFVIDDHEQPHPLFAADTASPLRYANDLLAALADKARTHGLALLLDTAVDRVSASGKLYAAHPDWFHPPGGERMLLDPRRPAAQAWIAHADFTNPDAAGQLTEWWSGQLRRWADAGIAGFRFDAPGGVPAHVWRRMAAAVREHHRQARFLAWTPGLARASVAALEHAGFDSVFSSLRWWDYRADWLVDEHAALMRVAPPIAFPESPFGERLATDFSAHDTASLERAYRRAWLAAAALGTGLLVPMGFEFGSTVPLRENRGSPAEFAAERAHARFDLSGEIARVNALVQNHDVLQGAGELRRLSSANSNATALLRVNTCDARYASRAALFVANADLDHPARVRPERLIEGIPGEFTRFAPMTGGCSHAQDAVVDARLRSFMLAPGGARLFDALRAEPVLSAPPPPTRGGKAAERRAATQAARAPRIAIENVTPSVDGGRFAAKRVVGEIVRVEADIFMDGHDKLAACVLWRAADAGAGVKGQHGQWREAPMAPLGNDRWVAHFPLERLGPYEFTIHAWLDAYGSLVEHIEKKLGAQQDVSLEIEEAQQLLARVLTHVATPAHAAGKDKTATAHNTALETELTTLRKAFGRANATRKLEIVLAPDTVHVIERARLRDFALRHPVVLHVLAERSAARFASWYELFPRSQSNDTARHGTFIDVIARLPAIRDMGFDVLYFPPIHPIGRQDRKGRNNTLGAEPEDVGSPYAIGAVEGGHTALHPELGSFDDFKTLLEAARTHGIELALDFAIQCAPDHPWLAEHPTWFAWRPDGSLRHAENPPKKYQDIVNPDFYAEDAIPALWLALRDVIAFWIAAGVRIFRVDNPHTKPLPFWEWMIGDIRGRHPDVIFLSEAFTRPKVMKRLAKVGFSQSYTYFTWRESKRDFIEYLSELTQTDARDYLRPNFFVNTPDINPRFLQSSGRAGFVIRAALAATLAGLWGVYSGFELCESAPLPASEEYLDSEKYQLRARDWNAPGNIIGEISLLNRIRRANPALHSHLGLTFLPAHNEHILFFEKATPSRDNVLLIAISLDPFAPQEADVELPPGKVPLAGGDALAVEDLVSGERFEMHGGRHHIRLDPAVLPFLIRRIAPLGAPFVGAPESAVSNDDPDLWDFV